MECGVCGEIEPLGDGEDDWENAADDFTPFQRAQLKQQAEHNKQQNKFMLELQAAVGKQQPGGDIVIKK